MLDSEISMGNPNFSGTWHDAAPKAQGTIMIDDHQHESCEVETWSSKLDAWCLEAKHQPCKMALESCSNHLVYYMYKH